MASKSGRAGTKVQAAESIQHKLQRIIDLATAGSSNGSVVALGYGSIASLAREISLDLAVIYGTLGQ
jgi:hypothetical protein